MAARTLIGMLQVGGDAGHTALPSIPPNPFMSEVSPPQEDGTHVLEVMASDSAGNTVVGTYVFTVDNADPVLSHPDDVVIAEGSPRTINWTMDDLSPSYYVLFLNGSVINEGQWNLSGESVGVSLEGLNLGTFNLTLVARDGLAHTSWDSVMVVIFDGTPPTVSTPDDLMYEEGETCNTVIWTIYDHHPVTYVILLDGTEIESHPWLNSTRYVTVNVDGLAVGVHVLVIRATDAGGNTASDEVLVTVWAVTSTTTGTTTTGTTVTTTQVPTTTTSTNTTATGTVPALGGNPAAVFALVSVGTTAAIVLAVILVRRRRLGQALNG